MNMYQEWKIMIFGQKEIMKYIAANEMQRIITTINTNILNTPERDDILFLLQRRNSQVTKKE